MIWLLNSLSWIFGHLPLRTVHAVGGAIGFFAWLFSTRKKEINQRLCDSLGVSAEEAKKVLRRMYRNLGFTVAEFLRIPHMSDEVALDLISYQNLERLPADHRYIALVAHTGNWELMAALTSRIGQGKMNVVVKMLKPAGLNEFVTTVRTHWGTRVHDKRGSSRNLLRVVKENEPLGFMLDQNMKTNWGVFVNFFGKQACTSDGLAQLAAISGYEIYPILCRRDPTSRKLIAEVGEQIPSPKDRSDAEILRVTAECTSKIEDFIRKYPDQWIWMHRRWRTQKSSGEAQAVSCPAL